MRERESEVKGSLNLICVLQSRTGTDSKMTPAGPGNPGISWDSGECTQSSGEVL